MSTIIADKHSISRTDLLAGIPGEIAPGPALPPLQPGEVLLEEFMRPAELTADALADQLGLPISIVCAVLAGAQRITAHLAILLGRYLGTSAELWMNLQTAHDLAMARLGLAVMQNGRWRAPRLPKGGAAAQNRPLRLPRETR